MDTTRGRGRGRGRARARSGSAGDGRVSGRGRSARSLDFTHAGPSGTQPSTSSSPARSSSPASSESHSQPKQSLTDQLKKVRMAKVVDKKHLTVLSAEQRASLAEKRADKQTGRYMMPDAPPPKNRNRKASPKRVPCPLVPGTPETPPPRKLQAWERSLPDPCCETEQAVSGPSTSRVEDEVSDDSRQIPFFSPSTGIVSAEFLHPDAQIVNAEIELVGFTPTSSIAPPPMERSTPSPEWLDPDIFDDNEYLGLPDHINPGSDVEEPDQGDAETEGQRNSLLQNEEDIPANLAHLLDEMNIRDDSALREAASSNPDMLHFDWSNDPEKFVGQQEVFSGDSGPTFSVDGLTPLDVFQRIWDADIIDTIVRESNRYGRQVHTAANKLWSDIDGNDIWIFLALIMLQSLLILPVEREYWYPCLALLKVGNFHDIMPWRKFLKIKKCLHFVDNNITRTAGRQEDKKLQKIWPIIEHLNDKFSSLYLPEQYIAIDESLLLWKGRLSFVQLITTKAARVGIKSYELCESRTGYLWKMLIYTGKGDKSQPAYETPANDDEPQGATSKIVHNLVRPLLNKGHTLVMDNFYNSPLLSRTLKKKMTDTMGTLRLKREFVPEAVRNLTKFNTRQGEVVYSNTEDLTITVWHDANMVAMISTYHNSVVGGKEKYGSYRYKPQVVLDYNMTMGGVDKKDQMLQAFPVERVRNLVWYKKLFRRLLNVSIYNAFVIYNHNKNGSQRQFRVTLAKEILEKINGQKPDPRKELRRTGHFPTNAETRRARCKMCSLKKLQTRTAYKCDTCNVNLCIIGCFKEYHLME